MHGVEVGIQRIHMPLHHLCDLQEALSRFDTLIAIAHSNLHALFGKNTHTHHGPFVGKPESKGTKQPHTKGPLKHSKTNQITSRSSPPKATSLKFHPLQPVTTTQEKKDTRNLEQHRATTKQPITTNPQKNIVRNRLIAVVLYSLIRLTWVDHREA